MLFLTLVCVLADDILSFGLDFGLKGSEMGLNLAIGTGIDMFKVNLSIPSLWDVLM